MAKVAHGMKFKLEIAGIAMMSLFALYLAVAYKKNWWPFTAAFKMRITSMLHGPAVVAPAIPLGQTLTIPAGTTFPPGTVLPPGTMMPAGTVLPANATLADGSINVGGVTLTAPIQVTIPTPNPDQALLTPAAGTGAITLPSGMLPGYTPKDDTSVNAIFQQELYKQLFLPYNKYPSLYGDNYRSSLVPPTQSVGGPNNNPIATTFNYTAAIQGGDVPPTDDPGFSQNQTILASNFGLTPPGGDSQTILDDQIFDPATSAGMVGSNIPDPTAAPSLTLDDVAAGHPATFPESSQLDGGTVADPFIDSSTHVPIPGIDISDPLAGPSVQPDLEPDPNSELGIGAGGGTAQTPVDHTDTEIQDALDAADNSPTVVPDIVRKCNRNTCKKKYHNDCCNECKNSTSKKCKDCESVCCASNNKCPKKHHKDKKNNKDDEDKEHAHMAFAYAANRTIMQHETIKQAHREAILRARQLRLLAQAHRMTIPPHIRPHHARNRLLNASFAIA